jgi:hypothetical protein
MFNCRFTLNRLILRFINIFNKGNAKRGVSPRLKIRPCDLDLWPWKSIGFQILLRSKYVKIFMNLRINRFKVNLQLNILFIRNLHITWLFIKYEWSLFGYWNLYYIRAKALDGGIFTFQMLHFMFTRYVLCSVPSAPYQVTTL